MKKAKKVFRFQTDVRKTWAQAEITHRGSSLKCNSFTNSGKPAAFLFLLMQIKVVDLIQEGSTAAGLFFDWLLGIFLIVNCQSAIVNGQLLGTNIRETSLLRLSSTLGTRP